MSVTSASKGVLERTPYSLPSGADEKIADLNRHADEIRIQVRADIKEARAQRVLGQAGSNATYRITLAPVIKTGL